MKPRALILLLCSACLVTLLWPPEVMSPSSDELASTSDTSGGGKLMDVSALVLTNAEESLADEVSSQEVEPQHGALRGRDYDSLTLQGEILAHEPSVMEAYLTSSDLHPGRVRFLEACAYLALNEIETSEKVWQTVSPDAPVSSVERAAVGRFLTGGEGVGAPVPASSEGSNAVVRGREMACMRWDLRRVQRAEDWPAACKVLSDLLEFELTADWDPHLGALLSWAEDLNAYQGFHRWSKNGAWLSLECEVQPGDSLVAIRKRVIGDRPELNICTGLIARANQLRDGNIIRPGQKLRIPLDPVHTMVDLSARFLLYYHGDEVVCAWPVTIGREGRTIPGGYKVGQKKEEPMWFPRGREPVPYGEPENPLGTRWIAWEGPHGLGFHGTSEEDQIGEEASDGCVRLKNKDVEELFEILPVGSDIVVQP